jgi:hypothetical protein
MTGKEKAREWLYKQLKKYNSTYFFPQAVKDKLNRLIEKYGSTCFW